ncbi:unnamed protein product [Pylaiella littoralis]
MEAVMDRQKKRAAEGDNVDYVLARTVRCILQYDAPLLSRRRGGGTSANAGLASKRPLTCFLGLKWRAQPP